MDMSLISSVTSFVSTASYQRSAGPSKKPREDIDQLRKVIETADLEATRTTFSSLTELQSSRKRSSTQSSDKKNPLADLLSQVGEALETGETSSVQVAFAEVEHA